MAAKLVGPNGTLLAKYTKPQSPPPHGGNLIFWDAGKNTKGSIVEALIQGVVEGLQNYKYIIIGQSNDYVAPTNNDTSAKCPESDVAAFLLAVEPGCFLGMPRGKSISWGSQGVRPSKTAAGHGRDRLRLAPSRRGRAIQALSSGAL
eukprot:m.168922 g.168922  ORF g.168922 m.168922 type:complete len:147 (-) comp14761_c0_seq2:138-578(-)